MLGGFGRMAAIWRSRTNRMQPLSLPRLVGAIRHRCTSRSPLLRDVSQEWHGTFSTLFFSYPAVPGTIQTHCQSRVVGTGAQHSHRLKTSSALRHARCRGFEISSSCLHESRHAAYRSVLDHMPFVSPSERPMAVLDCFWNLEGDRRKHDRESCLFFGPTHSTAERETS